MTLNIPASILWAFYFALEGIAKDESVEQVTRDKAYDLATAYLLEALAA